MSRHRFNNLFKYWILMSRSALEACAPEAAGQPGYEEVYPLMHALATKT